MNTRAWVGIGLVIVIIGIGWYFSSNRAVAPLKEADSAKTLDEQSSGMPVLPESQQVVIRYTTDGFSPLEVSIPVGATVTWSNETTEKVWVASGPHPAHTLYDGTAREEHCATDYAGEVPFDSCRALGAGESYSFTFTKIGAWPFHNHVGGGGRGKVTVAPASEVEMGVEGSVSN